MSSFLVLLEDDVVGMSLKVDVDGLSLDVDVDGVAGSILTFSAFSALDFLPFFLLATRTAVFSFSFSMSSSVPLRTITSLSVNGVWH